MFYAIWQRIRNVDGSLAAGIVFLILVSCILIYGISINPVSPNPNLFIRQIAYAVLGLVAFVFCSNINYRIWMMYSKMLYAIGALLLLVVLFLGTTLRGTTGWVQLGFIGFQPVEFAKIGLIIFLAKYLNDHGRHFFLLRHIVVSGTALLAYIGMVLMQPDLGSAIVLVAIWLLMLIVAGVPRKYLAALFILFVVVAVVSWMFVLKGYQKDRIVTFLNPQANALDEGYNVRQSVIAVGSGRLFGRGFGLGSQSQLKFLPESETDFIFAVLAEEFGLLGTFLLLGGLSLLMFRLLRIAAQTSDNFAAYYCLGVCSLFAVQSFINIGMNMGIAPVTGIPLPFVSAGGSSLFSLCAAFGIASSIVVDSRSLRND